MQDAVPAGFTELPGETVERARVVPLVPCAIAGTLPVGDVVRRASYDSPEGRMSVLVMNFAEIAEAEAVTRMIEAGSRACNVGHKRPVGETVVPVRQRVIDALGHEPEGTDAIVIVRAWSQDLSWTAELVVARFETAIATVRWDARVVEPRRTLDILRWMVETGQA